jgi:hypothetical protein
MKIKKDELKNTIEKIKKDKDVIAIMLFGSYARNKEYARDIDLCVFLNKNYTAKEIFKKRLNYLSGLPDKFDIQIFQQLPLYVKISVLKEGKMLFCKNEDLIYELAYETLKSYIFFEKHYLNYINQVK